jgi:hypothetical protein
MAYRPTAALSALERFCAIRLHANRIHTSDLSPLTDLNPHAY